MEKNTERKKPQNVDYKDAKVLVKYITEHGKILPRRMTGMNALQQRRLTTAIKRARNLGLIGYTSRFKTDDHE